MNSTMRLLTAVTLVGVAVSAHAFDDFDQKIANIDVLRDKNVQAELGITEGQRKTMNVYADKYSKANNDKIAEYQKGKKQPDQAFQTFMFNQYLTLRKGVLATLSPNQTKRLREITLQAAGPRALLDKAVADKVGMPTAEYTKFKAAINEGDQKVAKIKSQVSAKVREKYKTQKPPKTKAEADALQKKINTDLATEMKKHEAEMKSVLMASEKKTSSLVKPQYVNSLKVLMGKPFAPKAPVKK